jgi:hypothetical protein
LVQAVTEIFHQGILDSQQGHYYHNSTFVDDNGIADVHSRIVGTINNIAHAAYAIFGHPNNDHQAPCLSEEKMVELASFLMQYLGFVIQTQKMIMTWPVNKCQQLVELLESILAIALRKITLKQSSPLLGLNCNGAVIAPLAIYLSLHLQHQLNDVTHDAWGLMSHQSPWVWDDSKQHWI